MKKEIRLMQKENEKLEKLLSEEAEKVQTDIVVYLRGANIKLADQERLRRDITQIIIDGEGRGEHVADIIGGDYKAFCDSVIGETPQLSKKEKFIISAGHACLYVSVMMLIWLIKSVVAVLMGSAEWDALPVSVGDITSGILIVIVAAVVVSLIIRNSFDEGALSGWKTWFAIFAAVCLCVGSGVLLKGAAFSVHTASAVCVTAALYAINRLVEAKFE